MKPLKDLRIYSILLIVAILSGCALPSRREKLRRQGQVKEPSSSTRIEAPKKETVPQEIEISKKEVPSSKSSLALLEAQEKKANPGPELLTVWIQKAEAYEALDRIAESEQTLRQGVRTSEGQHDRGFQRKFLYKLAKLLERQDRTLEARSVWLDLAQRSQSKELPTLAEISSQLGLNFTKTKNEDEALIWFQRAEKELQNLKTSDLQSQPWYGQILFGLGDLKHLDFNTGDFSHLVQALKRNQVYLIKYIEVSKPSLVAEPIAQIQSAYTILKNRVLLPEVKGSMSDEEVAEARKDQDLRKEFALQLMGALSSLRIRLLPGQDSAQPLHGLKQWIVEIDKPLRQFIAGRPVGQGIADRVPSHDLKWEVKK